MGASVRMLLRSSLFVSAILSSAVSAVTVLPEPSGPYAVLHNTLNLTDESRIDSLDPKNGTRKLVLSSFYPVQRSACSQTCTIPYLSQTISPYIDALGAQISVPPNELSQVALQVCCKTTGSENKAASSVPLVLLDHGLSGTRLLHSALAEELASYGFAVVTMDHPFESVAVEFPDGSVVQSLNKASWNPAIPGALDPLLDIRVADAQFVLSQLKRREVAARVVPGATCGFNTERVAVLGHSFGGSTSIKLLMEDTRFVGGLNLDGQQFGTITDAHQPAVLFGAAGVTPAPHNSTTDPTWAETMEHLKGWKAQIGLEDIAHYGFCDLSIVNGTGALTLSKEVADNLLGTLDGKRSFEIVSTYARAFLEFVLRGKNTTLFDEPSEEFPEVVIIE